MADLTQPRRHGISKFCPAVLPAPNVLVAIDLERTLLSALGLRRVRLDLPCLSGPTKAATSAIEHAFPITRNRGRPIASGGMPFHKFISLGEVCFVWEGIDRHCHHLALAWERLVRSDKLGRIVVRAEIAGELAAKHPDANVLPNLEVKMGWIVSVAGADGSHLLASLQPLSFTDINAVKVTVEAVDEFDLTAFHVGMPDDDDIAPSCAEIPGVDDKPTGGAVNGIAQIRVTSADSVPVFPEMAVGAESSRLKVLLGAIEPHWQAKGVSKPDGHSFLRQPVAEDDEPDSDAREEPSHKVARG